MPKHAFLLRHLVRAVLRPVLVAASAVASLTAGACGGDSPTAVDNGVASVQITATSSNPRVGETTIIGATPVGPGGVAVQGVGCVYVSSNAAVLVVTPDGAGARGVGVSVGVANVTATCGGKNNSVSITVRPAQVTFSVSTIGTGSGSVFINPAGGTYDAGTSVTVTATPNTTSSIPSTFGGWGGACAPSGMQSTCTLTLTTSQTATATFTLGTATYVGTAVPVTAMGNVTAGAGCQYAITLSGSFSALVSSNAVGTLSGTTTGSATTGITTTFTPAGTTCTSNPFTVALSGAVSGSDAAASAVGSSSNNRQRFTFSGTRSGNTMTGTLTIMTITSDGVTDFTFTKVITPYTMTKP